MRYDDDELSICPECGEPFLQGESRAKICGDRKCALARRRRKYASNAKARAKDIARAKAWNAANRDRINAVRRARNADGVAPWYRWRAEDLPQSLRELLSTYSWLSKRAKSGKEEDRRAFDRVSALMSAARRIRDWTPADLANVDAALTNIRQEREG